MVICKSDTDRVKMQCAVKVQTFEKCEWAISCRSPRKAFQKDASKIEK